MEPTQQISYLKSLFCLESSPNLKKKFLEGNFVRLFERIVQSSSRATIIGNLQLKMSHRRNSFFGLELFQSLEKGRKKYEIWPFSNFIKVKSEEKIIETNIQSKSKKKRKSSFVFRKASLAKKNAMLEDLSRLAIKESANNELKIVPEKKLDKRIENEIKDEIPRKIPYSNPNRDFTVRKSFTNKLDLKVDFNRTLVLKSLIAEVKSALDEIKDRRASYHSYYLESQKVHKELVNFHQKYSNHQKSNMEEAVKAVKSLSELNYLFYRLLEVIGMEKERKIEIAELRKLKVFFEDEEILMLEKKLKKAKVK